MIVKPEGWPCTLAECRPGLLMFEGALCLKSEYGLIKAVDAPEDFVGNPAEVFCDSGEAFWGGTDNHAARATLMVQPVVTEWVEDE